MAQKNKPLVAVTGPSKKLKFGWWATRFVLWLLGLRAYYLCPGKEHIQPGTRGVIIGGGDDIEPEHYGITGDAGTTYDRKRDALEMAIIKKALEKHIPLVGICRGAQLINVVLGGNLYQDLRPLRKLTPNRNSIFPIKYVDLDEKSQLAKIFSCTTFRINSLHNQAVNQVADELHAVGQDRDGFIQAIEGEPFIIGVQWHPEYMPYSALQRRLFSAFAQAVSDNLQTLDEETLHTK